MPGSAVVARQWTLSPACRRVKLRFPYDEIGFRDRPDCAIEKLKSIRSNIVGSLRFRRFPESGRVHGAAGRQPHGESAIV